MNLKMCIGFEKSNYNLFGGMFLRNYDVMYDVPSESIRFVRARCDDSNLIGNLSEINVHELDLSKTESSFKNNLSIISRILKFLNPTKLFSSSKHHNLTIIDVNKLQKFSNKHFEEKVKKFIYAENTYMMICYFGICMFFIGTLIIVFCIYWTGCFIKKHEKNYQELIEIE